jgi:FtsH-binding integral membrane protein
VVVACTLYAFYTEEDYTTSSLLVIVLSVILFLLFIITLFTDSPFIRNLYCGVGVFLFSIYLIIDTQMIMGGKSVELNVDEYALAALLLYIDIITIFLYILQLLSNNRD